MQHRVVVVLPPGEDVIDRRRVLQLAEADAGGVEPAHRDGDDPDADSLGGEADDGHLQLRLDADRGGEAALAAIGLDRAAQRRRGFRRGEDQRLAGEVGPAHRGAAGERMRAVEHNAEALAVGLAEDEAGHWRRREHDAEIEPPVRQFIDQRVRHHLAQAQGGGGKRIHEPTGEAGDDGLRRVHHEAERQLADLAGAGAAGVAAGALETVEHLARIGEEALAGMGEADLAGMPLHQAHAERLFQRHDLPAQRRLREMQPRRGAAEMQRFGEGDEGAELAEIRHDTFFASIAT